MKPPAALLKKKSMKLYLILKAKSQAKANQHSCILFDKSLLNRMGCVVL